MKSFRYQNIHVTMADTRPRKQPNEKNPVSQNVYIRPEQQGEAYDNKKL
jgi:hypothetical protein